MSTAFHRVWRFFKILLIAFLGLLIIISVLPYFFRAQIREAVKKEINKQVEAKVDFEDFSLSLIRNFPNFTCRLDGLSITGINEFEGDTLAAVGSVTLAIDLFSVIEGDIYTINRITIDNPGILLKINEEGKANWDIAKTSEPGPDYSPAEEPSDFVLSLNKLEVKNANLQYTDLDGGLMLEANNLQHTLSGDFSANSTKMTSHTFIASLTFSEGGIDYIHNSTIDFKAQIDADLKNEIYTFRQNSLKINDLLLQFDGSVAMVNEDISITLSFNAPQGDFKQFLSLIPAVYSRDFENVQTSGKLAVDGFIKGIYNAENIPSFRVGIEIDDAYLKYPDLPHPLTDIRLKAAISSTGGSVNNTAVDISMLQLKILQNPLDIRLSLENLVEDPRIDGEVNGILDLSQLKEVYPLQEDEELQGKITANIAARGNLSAIENEQYDDFQAIGSLLVQGLRYADEDFKEGLLVRNAQLNFSPAFLDLINLDFVYKESDMRAEGKIEQYLGYMLSDKILTGRFNTSSTKFVVDNFMSSEENLADAGGSDTSSTTAFKVPAGVDFQLNASFEELVYEGVLLDNVKGTLLVKDETITIRDLTADAYEGNITINGSYSTLDRTDPAVSMDLSLDNVNITKAYASFGLMKKLAPVAEHVLGTFSTDLSFVSNLDQEMMPLWPTMMGGGSLNTSRISVENVKSLDMLANTLKMEQFRELDLNPLNLLFTIEEGRVNVKPFDLNANRIKANLSGWTAFDQTINYVMKLEVPRELFGNQANAVLDDLVARANMTGANLSPGQTINLDVLFTGTATEPKVSTNLANMGKDLIEGTRKQIEEELQKKKEEATQKVAEEAKRILEEADIQAQKILDEARVKADQVIMAAQSAAVEVRAESDRQSKKLMDDARGKGTLAELGAKKAAEEVKREGNKRAEQLVAEANKQAENIMATARAQAKKVKDDAQKKVDEMK